MSMKRHQEPCRDLVAGLYLLYVKEKNYDSVSIN
jgi:hypothetical protein